MEKITDELECAFLRKSTKVIIESLADSFGKYINLFEPSNKIDLGLRMSFHLNLIKKTFLASFFLFHLGQIKYLID